MKTTPYTLEGSVWGGHVMQEYIRKRVLDISSYILEEASTVRQTAQVFGVSKSTVHKDMTERLPMINKELANEIKQILEKNKAERHLRGGEATKKKYMEEKQQKAVNCEEFDPINELSELKELSNRKAPKDLNELKSAHESHSVNDLKSVNE